MEPKDVESRDDLIRYLAAMSTQVDSFENVRLETFLEAASGWLSDVDGHFSNRAEPSPVQPTWSLFAMIVEAATYYE